VPSELKCVLLMLCSTTDLFTLFYFSELLLHSYGQIVLYHYIHTCPLLTFVLQLVLQKSHTTVVAIFKVNFG